MIIKDIPALGLGTFRLQGEQAYQAVTDALDVGFRHIDTAQIYDNESEVGQALVDSEVPREEYFLTTKVWRTHLNRTGFIPSVKESLEKLGTDYVDLLLIHWPSPEDKTPMDEYLGELVKAKEMGLTKHIGVSNFTIAQLKEALHILPSGSLYVNQIEVQPFMQNREVRAFCATNDVKVTGYNPFYVGEVLKDEVILAIAKKHNTSAAQVALAWQLQSGLITIPASTNIEHMRDNFNSTRLTLASDDLVAIGKLDRGDRKIDPSFAPDWD
ncbi:MAG: 2,5-didehydrogluconate reductase DkgB [Oleibacter sp.]|nr:2,5-didehydrogluconate reductase DkgB [Thalassolituus sp.]